MESTHVHTFGVRQMLITKTEYVEYVYGQRWSHFEFWDLEVL